MMDLDELSDGEYTAVIDTIEDGFATVFFERDGEEVGSTVIDVNELPTDARHADAVLIVEITGNEISTKGYEPEETETRKRDAQDRFDRLSSRPPRDDDT